jgi:inorganic triphosphatase YgiF
MAVETELKLSLPAAALPHLRRHRLLAGVKPQRQHLENTYYDTADLALTQARVAVRHRRTAWGWLLTVKSTEPSAGGLAQRNEWEAPSQPGAFDFSHVDRKALRKRLEKLTPQLQPVFTTDFLRTTWMLTPSPGTRIEVALDRGCVRCGEREDAICELELELELIESPLAGVAKPLFDLALALQEDLPLQPAVASKAERGFRLFLQQVPTPVRAGTTPVTEKLSPEQAFSHIALDCIEQLQRNEAGARAGDDPEFVHQARIAIRRLRSALNLWAPVLPADFLARYRADWKALAQRLGDARNRDVFVTETLPPLCEGFPTHPVLQRLARQAGRQREKTQREVRAAFECPGFHRLVLGFTAAVHALPAAPLPVSLSDFANRRLHRFAREVAKRAKATRSDPQAHHALRIAFKRLRYALEFMAPLYPAKALRRYLKAATELQELLGAMNDIAVAEAIIAEQPRLGSDTLILGWFGGRRELLQKQLPHALKIFLAAPPPWQKKGSKRGK